MKNHTLCSEFIRDIHALPHPHFGNLGDFGILAENNDIEKCSVRGTQLRQRF